MFLDAENLFSEEQTVTTGSDTGVFSTNVIDLGEQPADIGVGENLYVVVQVTTALEGAGDTCDVELVSDSVSTLDDSLSVHQLIGTFAAASAAGSVLIARVQPGDFERYLGLRYIARGSGALSAGAFTAFLTSDVDKYKAYESNFVVA